MFPGMNPKQVEQAMKKLGVKQEAIEAEQVIIKCGNKNLIIKDPHVLKVNMMGQESLQISGAIEEEIALSEEDIQTVSEQANVSKEEARKVFEETNGDLAEAILKLQK